MMHDARRNDFPAQAPPKPQKQDPLVIRPYSTVLVWWARRRGSRLLLLLGSIECSRTTRTRPADMLQPVVARRDGLRGVFVARRPVRRVLAGLPIRVSRRQGLLRVWMPIALRSVMAVVGLMIFNVSTYISAHRQIPPQRIRRMDSEIGRTFGCPCAATPPAGVDDGCVLRCGLGVVRTVWRRRRHAKRVQFDLARKLLVFLYSLCFAPVAGPWY
jgi:hypothetical protein